MKRIREFLFGKPHVCTWGPVYLYRGYKFRNCTHPGCNIATAKDDYGNWLDPLPEITSKLIKSEPLKP